MPPTKYTYKVKVNVPPEWRRKKVTKEQFEAAGGVITPGPSVSYILPHICGNKGGRFWTKLPTYAKLRTALAERLYILDELAIDGQKFADAWAEEVEMSNARRRQAQRILEDFCKATDTKR